MSQSSLLGFHKVKRGNFERAHFLVNSFTYIYSANLLKTRITPGPISADMRPNPTLDKRMMYSCQSYVNEISISIPYLQSASSPTIALVGAVDCGKSKDEDTSDATQAA